MEPIWADQGHHPKVVAAEAARVKAARLVPHYAVQSLRVTIGHGGRNMSRIEHRRLSGAEQRELTYRRIHRDLCRVLRKMGWWIGRHTPWARRYRCLRDTKAVGAWGRMRLRLEAGAGYSKVEFYIDHNTEHPAGPSFSYESAKLMDAIDRARVAATVRRVVALMKVYGYADATEPIWVSAFDRVEWECQTCWHQDKFQHIYEPRKMGMTRNGVDGQGTTLTNGEIRYYYGRWGSGGTVRRGVVFHNINNMWWVVHGGERKNIAAFHLYRWAPWRSRRFVPDWQAAKSVRRQLDAAVKAENYERAIPLRDRARALEARP